MKDIIIVIGNFILYSKGEMYHEKNKSISMFLVTVKFILLELQHGIAIVNIMPKDFIGL